MNYDEMTIDQRLAKASAAASLMDNPTFREVIGEIREEFVQRIGSEPWGGDKNLIDELTYGLRALNQIVEGLQSSINDGKLLAKELAEEER